ncbi:Zonular occludens toxin (Zot) [Azotobacter beijerinckii]|uniref:Zonular occludens toxin (Zot) n=1 Tax=Azotobacter beijerinckii TaxID=170623 RepID=A0A1H8YZE0_9GAMM|nr:zonular occludens toxin domain-containing protein [Azotobacter beijerinckii]SEP57462.1 Zonular occludens toxin (Zot) [Azotobacter beijerinckii]
MSACLTIRTGLQGNGKTLNTIKEVDAQASKEGRPVYYHNVTDLKPEKLKASWYEFDDPLKWQQLPHNAIIVIDEAQGWFGVRDPRKDVPEHISAFEVMRKQGHEVHLITQDPRFIDVHARRLCNLHVHYWRIFGSSKVSRYETPRVVNDVEKLSSFSQSSRTIITLDRKFFDVYQSAKTEHHFKFRPSRKAVLSVLVILVVVYCSVVFYSRIVPDEAAAQDKPAASLGETVAGAAKAVLPGIVPDQVKSAPVSPAQYVAERKPRLDNLPASAPIYDELTEPKAFPKLYCMSSSDPDTYARERQRMASATVNGAPTVCQCYTQQGTRFKTDFQFCQNVVDYGFFDPTIPDRRHKGKDQEFEQQEPAAQPSTRQAQRERPADPRPVAFGSPEPVVVTDSDYSSKPWR